MDAGTWLLFLVLVAFPSGASAPDGPHVTAQPVGRYADRDRCRRIADELEARQIGDRDAGRLVAFCRRARGDGR